MAEIHNAYNELEEKISSMRNNRIKYRKERYNNDVKYSFFLIFLGILLVFLVFKFPNIAHWFKNLAAKLLGRFDHPLLPVVLPELSIFRSFLDHNGLLRFISSLLDGTINLMIFILILIVDFVAHVFCFATPYIIWLCTYLVPIGMIVLGGYEFYSANETNRFLGSDFYSSEEEEILQAGLDGERKALSEMQRLPDSCHVFTNLKIPCEGKVSETDMIIVSDTGVTIVEVKNHKGTITGSAHDEHLSQLKIHGRNETDFKTFYNPIKQVATHAYRLKEYLHANGVHIRVRTCVFFINEEAHLQLKDVSENCPVYHIHNANALRLYLTSGGTRLNEYTKDNAISLLEDLMYDSYLESH